MKFYTIMNVNYIYRKKCEMDKFGKRWNCLSLDAL